MSLPRVITRASWLLVWVLPVVFGLILFTSNTSAQASLIDRQVAACRVLVGDTSVDSESAACVTSRLLSEYLTTGATNKTLLRQNVSLQIGNFSNAQWEDYQGDLESLRSAVITLSRYPFNWANWSTYLGEEWTDVTRTSLGDTRVWVSADVAASTIRVLAEGQVQVTLVCANPSQYVMPQGAVFSLETLFQACAVKQVIVTDTNQSQTVYNRIGQQSRPTNSTVTSVSPQEIACEALFARATHEECAYSAFLSSFVVGGFEDYQMINKSYELAQELVDLGAVNFIEKYDAADSLMRLYDIVQNFVWYELDWDTLDTADLVDADGYSLNAYSVWTESGMWNNYRSTETIIVIDGEFITFIQGLNLRSETQLTVVCHDSVEVLQAAPNWAELFNTCLFGGLENSQQSFGPEGLLE